MTKARSNATANAAKGDLTVGNGTNLSGVLAVGNNGETIVADSSTSTGLSYQANWAAGKNKFLNGDFRINQRNFSSTSSTGIFMFDRWSNSCSGGQTYTAQTFTPGAAPVAGYEGTNFLQIATTAGGANFASFNQKLEDVRVFAGQTVTMSFWAKANSGTPNVLAGLYQNFGTGGSAGVDISAVTPIKTITTSWARYTWTFNVPSISGKTIGTNSHLECGIQVNNVYNAVGQQTNTFQIWGVQIEAGSVATAFQTATGTLQGELAACMRYYYRTAGSGVYAPTGLSGVGQSSVGASLFFVNPVPMRTNATAVEYANVVFYDGTNLVTISNLYFQDAGITSQRIGIDTASGLVQYRPGFIIRNNNAAGYVAFSAEL